MNAARSHCSRARSARVLLSLLVALFVHVAGNAKTKDEASKKDGKKSIATTPAKVEKTSNRREGKVKVKRSLASDDKVKGGAIEKSQKTAAEEWNIEKIEIPVDQKLTESEIAMTKFWNYLDGPEIKDDVILKNGHRIRQIGYNVEFIDLIIQENEIPFLIFKSSSCRGACGGGYFYVIYNPAKKEYFEFPLPKEGYVHEDGEIGTNTKNHLWLKTEAYYGKKCGEHANALIVYRQERECASCPHLHEFRVVKSAAGGSMNVDMLREQGKRTPKNIQAALKQIKKDLKKKRCRTLQNF